MSLFETALLNAIPPITAYPGDFRDADGYLCCGKCKGRREMRLSILGEERVVPVLCACQREQDAIEEAARKLAERRSDAYMAVDRLRELSIAEKPVYTFAQNDSTESRASRIAARYTAKFDDLRAQNIGLMLYGSTGSGKTFLAHCIASDLLEKGWFVWLTTVRALADRMGDSETKARIVKALHRADLLILDDFGAERATPYMIERCYDIVNERYNAKKPLVITTNLDPSVMMQEQDLTYRRIYDRINGLCTPVLVDGKTRRKTEAVNKMIALKAILEE